MEENCDIINFKKSDKYFLVFASAFVVLLVLTNVIGAKLFASPYFGFALTTGIITYPLTFLLTDVMSEIWGAKRTNFVVFLGFFLSLLMLVIVQAAIHLEPHDYWSGKAFGIEGDERQKAFEFTFYAGYKLLLGSMTAYMIAQLLDVKIYHYLKRLTKGKHLWLRNNGSTMISQLFDTFIVNSFLFYWAFGWGFMQGIEVMGVIYLYKLAIALIDTPLIYVFVSFTKKQIDFKDEAYE
ncbi:MAG: hypothetical protein COA79_21270 [Planctomycetota bacterium]|nr:MAG: hypothetical protein COA79_21270 [Planctomycetota bacterium]